MSEDLRAALTDVRKAYRLVWMYNRRVMDIAKMVSESFNVDFYAWDTNGYNRPPKFGTNILEYSELVTLPFYSVSFLFLGEGANNNIIRPGDWMLEIQAESDSGYLDSEEDSPKPLDLSPVEQCLTHISLYGWYATAAADANWFFKVWVPTSWPDDDDVSKLTANPAVSVVRKTFDASDLDDGPAIEKAVNEFRHILNRHSGIDVQQNAV